MPSGVSLDELDEQLRHPGDDLVLARHESRRATPCCSCLTPQVDLLLPPVDSHVRTKALLQRLSHRVGDRSRVSSLIRAINESQPVGAPTTSVVRSAARRSDSNLSSGQSARPRSVACTGRREEEPADRASEATREGDDLVRRRCSVADRCRTSSRSLRRRPGSADAEERLERRRWSVPASSRLPRVRVGSCRRRSGGPVHGRLCAGAVRACVLPRPTVPHRSTSEPQCLTSVLTSCAYFRSDVRHF